MRCRTTTVSTTKPVCALGRWAYRGAISNDRPSEVIPLQWPAPDSSIAPDMATQPGQVQLGFSLEPLSELHISILAHMPPQPTPQIVLHA